MDNLDRELIIAIQKDILHKLQMELPTEMLHSLTFAHIKMDGSMQLIESFREYEKVQKQVEIIVTYNQETRKIKYELTEDEIAKARNLIQCFPTDSLELKMPEEFENDFVKFTNYKIDYIKNIIFNPHRPEEINKIYVVWNPATAQNKENTFVSSGVTISERVIDIPTEEA